MPAKGLSLIEFNDVEVPGPMFPGVIIPALLFLGGVARMTPRAIGVNAGYALFAAAGWTYLWTFIYLFLLDLHNEILWEVGTEPADGYEDLDNEGLEAWWPSFYWSFYLYASWLSIVTLYERSGYLSVPARIRGTLYHFLVFRVPALALGALFCLISLKFVEDEEADNKGDKDEDKDVSVGTLMVGWVKICFNVPGQLVYALLFGIGLGSVPFSTWYGTYLQLQTYYKRTVIKLQNTVTFCTKKMRAAVRACEDERDALPVSDPAYTLYVAVLKNPGDPFEADVAFRALNDPDYAPDDDDDGEEPVQRLAHLENVDSGDHAEIARIREEILESRYDMALAEAEAGAAEKRLEDIQNSGRTGVSPIAVAGGVVTAFTAFWSAWIVWYLFMAPIVQSNELDKDISGFHKIYDDSIEDENETTKPALICLQIFYHLAVTGFALVQNRRWFGIYTLGFASNSVTGSVLRFTEVWMYLVNPWAYQFVVVYRMWEWDAEEDPDTAYQMSFADMTPLPFLGKMYTRWIPFLVVASALGTVFLSLPAKVQNLLNRHKLHAMNEDEFRRKRAREEASKNAGAAGLKSDFAIFGLPLEGSELHATGEIVSSAMEVRSCDFEWARRRPEDEEWENIPGAASDTYVPTAEDIGFLLRVVATPRSDLGEQGQPVVATTTERIKIALPSVRNLRIEGGPYHTAGYRIKADYVGGIEGDSIVQWFKIKSGVSAAIPGANDFVFVPSIDDVACTLKVEYTPVRADGRKGATVAAESHSLKIDPSIGKLVKNHIVSGSAEFAVDFLDQGSKIQRAILVSDKALRVRERKTIKVRMSLSPAIQVILEPTDPRKFKVIGDDGNIMTFFATDSRARDELCLTIRSFIVMASDRDERKRQGKK
eukprot:TRINITY_DN383_c0_g1_i1.p1 TRINITY_DN383_c0_g1~~TRINITY_DN383_c0_g1_i1.p1  ORF type:complete len:882 (-),score=318.13 TRINITY_DN383_c0_g1_i1:36-2681(-)